MITIEPWDDRWVLRGEVRGRGRVIVGTLAQIGRFLADDEEGPAFRCETDEQFIERHREHNEAQQRPVPDVRKPN